MGGNCRDWTSLPNEILEQIFYCKDEEDYVCDAYESVLVCKAWLSPAQSALYSKVSIRSLEQFKNFHRIVKQDSHLGKLVRSFEFNLRYYFLGLSEEERKEAIAEISHLFEDLLCTHLPNLEELSDRPLDSYFPLSKPLRFYFLILKALQNSQLTRLRRLYTPDHDLQQVMDYAACTLLLKDRLEKIDIMEDGLFDKETSAEHLKSVSIYNNLNCFEELTDLTLMKTTNEGIQVLEYVINSCRSLKQLSFILKPNEKAEFLTVNSSVSIDAISSYSPAPQIESLRAHLWAIENSKIFLYIMHKFPQIKKLTLLLIGTDPLDPQMLTQLLHHSTRVDSFHIGNLYMDHDNLCRIVGDFWEATSKPGYNSVEFDYSDEIPEANTFNVIFQNMKHLDGTAITFNYSVPHRSPKYAEFMKKNGKFIGQLFFKISKDGDPLYDNYDILQDFIEQVFKHCRHLESLTFEQCVLNQYTYSSVDLCKPLSLKELVFEDCYIFSPALEQLSLLLPKVKRLCFCRITYRTAENRADLDRYTEKRTGEIIMPYTEIETIVFAEEYGEQILYFKVFAVAEREYHYYTFDQQMETSSEQEYIDAKDDSKIHIICQTKPNKFEIYRC